MIKCFKIEPAQNSFDINLKEIFEHRELLYFFIWKNIKVRYKQTIVGGAWAIIQPFFLMVIFSIFFGKLAKIPSEGLPYPIFYYSALIVWTYFANALTSATSVMVENQRMITKVYFPRIYLPLSSVLSGLLDFAVSLGIFFLLIWFYHIYLTWKIILIFPFLILAMLSALGFGLWLSALNAMYRDVRYVILFIIQFWMFASPVAYSSNIVPYKWRWLYGLNPMAGIIDGFRWALLSKGNPPNILFAASVVGVLVIFISGVFFFQMIQKNIADRI